MGCHVVVDCIAVIGVIEEKIAIVIDGNESDGVLVDECLALNAASQKG